MKKIGTGLLYLVVFLILGAVIILGYITLALPNVGKPEDIKIALTPQRVARGAYLANHVNLCMDCHSDRDWSKPIGPIPSDKLGAGGTIFDASDGFPGEVQAPNITPFKLKDWSDGEIFRAITTGVRKDGSAIFPLMPWQNYSKMDREGLYSIIAYLRTLKSIETPPYKVRSLDFPLGIIIHLMPQKAMLGRLPLQSDTLKYGAYLLNAAGCNGCHSPRVKGDVVPGMDYAGGNEFKIGSQSYFSSNITPDKNTGIGKWTSGEFVELFKSHTDSARAANPLIKMAVSVMPFYDYSGMKTADLKAIYAYLMAIKPVNHKVSNL